MDASAGVEATVQGDVVSWSSVPDSGESSISFGSTLTSPKLVRTEHRNYSLPQTYITFSNEDVLLSASAAALLPTDNADRTVFAVARYNTSGSTGQFGFGWGSSCAVR